MTYFLLYLALGFILTYFSIYVKEKDKKQEAKRQNILKLIEDSNSLTNVIVLTIAAILAPIFYLLKVLSPKRSH